MTALLRTATTVKIEATASIALCLSSCTFGTLSTSKCLKFYAQGAVEGSAAAQAGGPIIEETYRYCADGRARIDAMVVPLRAHGFQPSEPDKHFEVPGGWCLSAKRPVASARFDAMRSLETICAIGDASRAYFTGGSLTTRDGKTHDLISTYDRAAREELRRRLEQKRR